MNEQKKLTPELEGRVQQAVDNFMQGFPLNPVLGQQLVKIHLVKIAV